MKFIFDFLKKLIPPSAMIAGGAIPITLTSIALTSSIPTNEKSSSLTTEISVKPAISESTITPTKPPKRQDSSEDESTKSENGQSQDSKETGGTGTKDEAGDGDGKSKGDESSSTGKENQESTDGSSSADSSPDISSTSQSGTTTDQSKSKKPKPKKPVQQIKGLFKRLQKQQGEKKTLTAQDVLDLLKSSIGSQTPSSPAAEK